MLKIFQNSQPPQQTDEYRRLFAAYKKQKSKGEALESENSRLKEELSAENEKSMSLKIELSHVVELSKKAVSKARAQQKNSKERAQRLAERLKKQEGQGAETA